jgi:hypothetical protein
LQLLENLERLSALNLAEDMTRSISSSKKIFVDKNKRRESLIQSEEIDEEKHAVSSYHIDSMKEFVH